MDGIGTTLWTGEVEPRLEQRSRVASGTETGTTSGTSCRAAAKLLEKITSLSPQRGYLSAGIASSSNACAFF